MKKTSFIFLTLVASFSVTMGVAQTDSIKNSELTDFIYEPKRLYTTQVGADTIRRDSVQRDTVPNQPPVYNYYYRSRFWNGWFRLFAPRRYYSIINRPGYYPRRVRSDIHVSHHGHSFQQSGHAGHLGSFGHPAAGGFGRSGSHHSQSN